MSHEVSDTKKDIIIIYMYMNYRGYLSQYDPIIFLPVVPHKAAAEVSKIGNL